MIRRSAVILVVGALSITPAEAGVRVYALAGGQGILELTVPSGWVEEPRSPSAEGPPAFVFYGEGADDFRVLIVPFGDAAPDIAGMVRDAARGIAPLAAETEIEIKTLGGDAEGYWFGYTDATLAGAVLPAGEYRYTVQGAALVGELTVVFTVLTNDSGSDAIAETLRMMRAARYRRGL